MTASEKLVSLPEAVARHVRDGDLVFVGGFGQGVPFAAGREVIRQGRRNLTLCRTGADILFDILVAAGCVSGVKFGWYGNPGIGLSHVLRRAVADGSLTVEETSNFGLLLGLHAARLGVPFLPARILLDGDLPDHAPGLAQVVCPFTGETLSAVAAIRPDVALIHAQQADAAGNVQLWGIKGDSVEGAEAARRVICTVERIVPSEVIAEDPSRTVLAANMVTAVALAPMGAYPSYVDGVYGRDDAAYRAFESLSRKPDALADYIKSTVHAFASHEEFAVALQAGGWPMSDRDAPWRMAWLGAQQIRPAEVVFVGIGAPCQAAMLARRMGNDQMTMIFESGVIGADPDEMPLSTGSPSVAKGAAMITDMLGVFALLQRGGIDLGILSGAEVDARGNLNSTVIGPYGQPKLRLPGSGGAHDIALLARRVMILMPHDPKRFVARVDFITSPGHGPHSGRPGLGAGPAVLVTTRAVFEFHAGKPVLAAHFDDLTTEEATDGIGWDIAVSPDLHRLPVPDASIAQMVQSFGGDSR